MKITIRSPSRAVVTASNDEIEALHKELTFTNTAVQHEIKRTYDNFWFRSKNHDGWQKKLDELKIQLKRTLVFTDHETYIHPGSIPYISFPIDVENKIVYPTPKKIAWEKPLPFKLYPYQEESWQKLLQVKHGNVELCPGSGKTAIILKICRETGFRTAIIAPSKPIFEELVLKFETHFGRSQVGTFGDGKKKLGKRFTICIGDSVTNIQKGTEEWDFFSKLNMVCVDESHTWGAETLESICFGVLADISYRFFFSGTQTRGDGTEKLLQSIIGQTVHTLTTAEAIRMGYICPHDFKIVMIESSNPNFNDTDVLKMKRAHFLKNRNICSFIAKLANAEAKLYKRQTLVLVEELEQISMLVKLLEVPYAYAHSEKKAQRLEELGIEKVKSLESVEKFNKGEAMILIGTSCISTGTNIYPTHNSINWQGGASEIRTKQGAIGRTVRLGHHNPWMDRCTPKLSATIWDFNVYDCHIMSRHLEVRTSFYQESGTAIRTIRLK